MGYVWCEIRQQSSEEPCDETSFGKNAFVLLDRRQTGSPKKGYKSPSSSPGTFGGPKTTLADLEVEKLDLLVCFARGDGLY